MVKIFFLLFDSPYHLSMFQCGVEERRRRKKEKKMCLEVNLNFHFIQNLQLDDDIHPTIPTSRVTLKFNLIKFISRNVLYDWKEAINSLQRSTSELRVHRRIRNKKTWMNVQETTHNKQQLEYNSVDIDLIFILLNLKDYFLILFLFHSKYIICCCCCCTDIVLFFCFEEKFNCWAHTTLWVRMIDVQVANKMMFNFFFLLQSVPKAINCKTRSIQINHHPPEKLKNSLSISFGINV